MNIKKELVKILFSTVSVLFADRIEKDELVEIFFPADGFGDYSTNLALKLASKQKTQPREIAEKIKKEIEKKRIIKCYFEKIEVAGPGFLNFCLSPLARGKFLQTINQEGVDFGKMNYGKGRRVHLDFVSANPTGPIHLGNGRGGPYGDTLAKILEKVGFSVWREYYVNDFGNQIKILGHSVLQDEKAQYKGEYVEKLAKKNKERDPLEAGKVAAQVILKEMIKPTMEKLGIFFDQYFLESSLHQSGEIKKVFSLLQKKGYLTKREDALWFLSSLFGDEKDRVVQKKSGEITYFGGDIAYHYNKLKKRGFDQAIDIWGADHHGDVKRILGAMKALGCGGKTEIILIQNLTVLKGGKEFKMSKRKGQYVCLDDLIEEVGIDAVRFHFLSFSANSSMVFDVDLAKEKSNNNPVYYVQYASARMAGILKKTADLEEEKGMIDFTQLKHEKEKELIKHLIRFPELILEIAKSKEVHQLTHYAVHLADKFHSFYQECRILGEKKVVALARRELVKASWIVLKENLRLLGVKAPEKM